MHNELKKSLAMFLCAAILLLGLIGCKGKEDGSTQLVSELFNSLYSVDETVLTEYEDYAEDSNLSDEFVSVLSTRFSHFFTDVANDIFFSNRQCDFFMERIKNNEISSIDSLNITEKSSDEGSVTYLVKGNVSYTSGSEQQISELTAEVRTISVDDEWKIESLFFTILPQ